RVWRPGLAAVVTGGAEARGRGARPTPPPRRWRDRYSRPQPRLGERDTVVYVARHPDHNASRRLDSNAQHPRPAARLPGRISALPALDTRRPGVILGSCSPFYCAEDGCGLVAQRWLPTPRIRQPPRCDDAEPAWVAGG